MPLGAAALGPTFVTIHELTDILLATYFSVTVSALLITYQVIIFPHRCSSFSLALDSLFLQGLLAVAASIGQVTLRIHILPNITR